MPDGCISGDLATKAAASRYTKDVDGWARTNLVRILVYPTVIDVRPTMRQRRRPRSLD